MTVTTRRRILDETTLSRLRLGPAGREGALRVIDHLASGMGRLRRLVVLAAVIVAAFAFVAPASATVYFSGNLTENYHNFGRCFYDIGSECSGWNYWVKTTVDADYTDGSYLIAFENDSTIRGDIWSVTSAVWLYAMHKGMGGWYIKGSISIWTASLLDVGYADVCIGSCP